MAGRKLAVFVDVHDDDGVAHCFGPGDEPPEWAVARINRPDVWASLPAVGTEDPADTPQQRPRPDEPPRVGRGSGRDAWAAHAAALNIDIDPDASRADIIAAVDAHREGDE